MSADIIFNWIYVLGGCGLGSVLLALFFRFMYGKG